MAWGTVRKEDKPFDFDENLVLVEYSNGGRLYMANNRENIGVNEDDYLAVSYIPTSENDSKLPVVAVRGLCTTGSYFKEVCKWLNFNPKHDSLEIMPRYHEESVIKNISDDNANNGGASGEGGGMIIISINPATGEEVSLSDGENYKPSLPSNMPKPDSSDNEEENDESNSSNDSNSDDSEEDESNSSNNDTSHSVNESEESNLDSYDDDFFEELKRFEQEKKEREEESTKKIGDIFAFIKKVH